MYEAIIYVDVSLGLGLEHIKLTIFERVQFHELPK